MSAPVKATPAVASTVESPSGDLVPVTISKAELSRLLAEAVQAGRAQGPVVSGEVVTPEKPERWSLNRLMRELAFRAAWHDERSQRAAVAAVEEFFPDETEDAEIVG